MRLTRAELSLDADGRLIEFVNDGSLTIGDEKVPVLMIEVNDFEDAQELLATIERSLARKKKDSPSAPAAKPEPPSGGKDSQRELEPGDQVGGADSSHQTAAPAGAQEKDRGAGAERPAGSAIPGAGPTAAPAAAKKLRSVKLSCGGTNCRDDGKVEHHDPSDPTCVRAHRAALK